MNIIAISYKNIGPFKDQLITINFLNGKYLLKAPIGKGKSFLFFDGPLFAFYKYSTRQILNRKSSSGHVNMFFESNSEYFLIERLIKTTKTGGESTSSRLFRIEGMQNIDPQTVIGNQIIRYDIDIYKLLLNKYKFEEISFKNNNELQAILDSFIGPREVFLSTNFLMQDSDNIFEMIPSERINVFKEIFGLMGIDQAKEKIGEKRREIQINIKLKNDTTKFDEKLKKNLNLIISKINPIIDYSNKNSKLANSKIKSNIKSFFKNDIFQDIDFIADKIAINNFEISNVDIGLLDQISGSIKIIYEDYSKINNKLENCEKIHSELSLNIKENQSKKIEYEARSKILQDKISKIDQEYISRIKKDKLELLNTQNKLIDKIDFDRMSSYKDKIQDIYEANSLIDSLSQEGKTLKARKEVYTIQIKALENEKNQIKELLRDKELVEGTSEFERFSKEKINLINENSSQIESDKMMLANLEEKNKFWDDQIQNIETKLDGFSKELNETKEYYCQKINGNCPYIQEIKSESLESIQKQIKTLEFEKESLLKQKSLANIPGAINQIEKRIDERRKFLDLIEANPEQAMKGFFEKSNEEKAILSQKIKEFDEKNGSKKKQSEIEELDKNISEIKEFLFEIDWKDIKEKYGIYKDLDNKIKSLDIEINKLEEESHKIAKYKEDVIKVQSELELIARNIEDFKAKQRSNDTDKINLKEEKEEFDYENLKMFEQDIAIIKNSLDTISSLIEDFKNEQLMLKQLKEEEKIFNDLFQIFSKELMLVVLQDFLPSLADIINNYLSQIVEYQLKFNLKKSKADKLELEINVVDDKGLRAVKSLSGGQKIVLKLVWVLAVSSLLKVRFLFMDETINNLDQNTVGKVADLLENYVKSHDMKFYVVTHSRQIQDMAIWDEVVEI